MPKSVLARRNTKQKGVILEELRKTRSHPTADELFLLVRQKIPSISFGTVYRNLNLLRDQGEILELACGKYRCHYDGMVENHYHFCCLACDRIFDLDERVLDYLDNKISTRSGFVVMYHRLLFYGYCMECRERGKYDQGKDLHHRVKDFPDHGRARKPR